MTIFKAVILGILQGLAEFLPISSSGHLVLFQKILGIEEPGMTFDILLHIGTLIPVFIVFWKDIWSIIKNPFQKMTLFIIIGTIPTVIVALLFNDLIESLFDGSNALYLALAFFFTGIVLLYANQTESGKKDEKTMNIADSLVVGCMQAIAILPGVSRSGSTISGALFRRVNRETAAKYAFLLSIPAILGAAVLKLKDFFTGGGEVITSQTAISYTAGFIASAIFGYIAIRFMLKIISECKLKYFSYYVFVLGALILLDKYVFNLFF